MHAIFKKSFHFTAPGQHAVNIYSNPNPVLVPSWIRETDLYRVAVKEGSVLELAGKPTEGLDGEVDPRSPEQKARDLASYREMEKRNEEFVQVSRRSHGPAAEEAAPDGETGLAGEPEPESPPEPAPAKNGGKRKSKG